mmetsp:Transcript_19300/g.31073  ORF Transcript_19300/g.31073 Transcript_19300/m.31073 type:complete len:208 (-) Transcript_19300:1368-1991(-)
MLNAVYFAMSSLDGISFLSHQIKIQRVTKKETQKEETKGFLAEQTKFVYVTVLEEVTDRLLANPAIDAKMLLDAIERKIYVNCMVVISRVLAVIVNSFRLTVCGHVFGLTLEPHQFEDSAMNVVAHSLLSRIDIDKWQEFAESCGIPREDSETMTEGFSLLNRIWNRIEFMANLQACLYSLVLGILNDMLTNSKTKILLDDISLEGS